MVDAAAGPELADVGEPLQTRRDLDEGAERLEPHDAPLDPRARGEALGGVLPGIALEGLARQRDALAVLGVLGGLDLEHLDLDLLADLEHVLGMGGPRKADLAHVEHALEAAEVDEGAVVGERRHLAAHHGSRRQAGAGLLGLGLGLLLEQGAPRQHDVRTAAAAPLLVARDLEGEPLADEPLGVVDVAQLELGERTEGAQAGDLHLDAALDHGGDQALDRDAALVGRDQLGRDLLASPDAPPEHQGAGLGIDPRHLRFDRVADGDGQRPLGIGDLGELDDPLGLAAEVDERRFRADRDDLPAHFVSHLGRSGSGGRLSRLALLELGQDGGEIFVVGAALFIHRGGTLSAGAGGFESSTLFEGCTCRAGSSRERDRTGPSRADPVMPEPTFRRQPRIPGARLAHGNLESRARASRRPPGWNPSPAPPHPPRSPSAPPACPGPSTPPSSARPRSSSACCGTSRGTRPSGATPSGRPPTWRSISAASSPGSPPATWRSRPPSRALRRSAPPPSASGASAPRSAPG